MPRTTPAYFILSALVFITLTLIYATSHRTHLESLRSSAYEKWTDWNSQQVQDTPARIPIPENPRYSPSVNPDAFWCPKDQEYVLSSDANKLAMVDGPPVDLKALKRLEPPKGAIVYLLDPKQGEIKRHVQSLTKLVKYWLDHPLTKDAASSYPILMLHDKPVSLDSKSAIRDALGEYAALVEYVPVTFRYPPGVFPNDKAKTGVETHGNGFPGYNSMINFFFQDIFDHPRLTELEYYWRLDTDSYLASPISIDLFRYMKIQSLSYIYQSTTLDWPQVTGGLLDLVEAYVSQADDAAGRAFGTKLSKYAAEPTPNPNFARTQYLAKENCLPRYSEKERQKTKPLMYNNNFELVDIQRFKQADTRHFADEVERTRAVWTRRWGDAPLRYYSAKLCLDVKVDVANICWIDYEHHRSMAKTCGLPVDSNTGFTIDKL